MRDAVIVEAVRTPVGRRGGGLATRRSWSRSDEARTAGGGRAAALPPGARPLPHRSHDRHGHRRRRASPPGWPSGRSRRCRSSRRWLRSSRRRARPASPASGPRRSFCVNVLGAPPGGALPAFAAQGGDKFAGVDVVAGPVRCAAAARRGGLDRLRRSSQHHRRRRPLPRRRPGPAPRRHRRRAPARLLPGRLRPVRTVLARHGPDGELTCGSRCSWRTAATSRSRSPGSRSWSRPGWTWSAWRRRTRSTR